MEVSIKTEGGQFKAQLRLPRALVLSAVLSIAGAVVEAIRCESNIRELRAQLEHCQQKPMGVSAQEGGQ